MNASRRKQGYFNVGKSQKNEIKKNIMNQLANLQFFAKENGLQIESILLNRLSENENEKKIIINIIDSSIETSIDEDYKIFRCLIAKDLANLSCRKYKLIRKYFEFKNIPGINKIYILQKKINNFFKIKNNEYGFYCDAEQ